MELSRWTCQPDKPNEGDEDVNAAQVTHAEVEFGIRQRAKVLYLRSSSPDTTNTTSANATRSEPRERVHKTDCAQEETPRVQQLGG